MPLSEQEEFELLSLERARMQRGDSAPKSEKSISDKAKNYAIGAGETVAQFGSGAAGSIVGGLAGFGTGINKALGLTQQEPAEAVRGVSQALTYQPRTEEGVQLSNIVNYPFEKIAEGADYVGRNIVDKTGNPTLGMQAATTLQGIPMLFGGVRGPVRGALKRSESAAEGRASAMSERNATLEAARNEGLVVPPSATGGGNFLTNRLESLSGKAATKQQASVMNAEKIDAIGRREAGLAENEPLSFRTLAEARNKMAEPYRQVAALSEDAAQALDILKDTRFEANSYRSHYYRSGDPASLKKAKELEKEASGWEQTIEQEAVRAGHPELLPKLREARRQIAKNYDVEKALNAGEGSLDARVIGRMLDKKRPLSGGLETIGRFAEAFGDYAQPGAINKAAGVSKLEMGLGAILGTAGYGAAGPAGIAAAALPLLSHPARSLLLSKVGQVSPKYQSNAALRLVDSLANAPAELSSAESGNQQLRLRDMRLQAQ